MAFQDRKKPRIVSRTPNEREQNQFNLHLASSLNRWSTATLDNIDSATALTWTCATTDPAIGNGAITAYWRELGGLVYVQGEIAMGSTTTYGVGQWRVGIPFTGAATAYQSIAGMAFDFGTQANRCPLAGVIDPDGTYMRFSAHNGIVDATGPFTWATDDRLIFSGWYQPA